MVFPTNPLTRSPVPTLSWTVARSENWWRTGQAARARWSQVKMVERVPHSQLNGGIHMITRTPGRVRLPCWLLRSAQKKTN
eukprot:6124458-Karenia_brevis.AAC.1